ncbi:MAG: 5'-methylthioadenosine/S-adenosylhomocysteine nucleosidase [Chloroflexota bacterium]
MNDEARRLLVICAMESEAVHLRTVLEGVRQEAYFHWPAARGRLGNYEVWMLTCGIGMVDAASAAVAGTLHDHPAAVLNYGCSGAHRDDIRCGDVVIADSVVNLGTFVVEPDGNRRPLNFHIFEEDGSSSRTIPALLADARLLERARSLGEQLSLPAWPGEDRDPDVHVGPVGSADVWTQHQDSIRNLHDVHGTLCEDMEAAAIGQVCQRFGVPFFSVKDISNN